MTKRTMMKSVIWVPYPNALWDLCTLLLTPLQLTHAGKLINLNCQQYNRSEHAYNICDWTVTFNNQQSINNLMLNLGASTQDGKSVN